MERRIGWLALGFGLASFAGSALAEAVRVPPPEAAAPKADGAQPDAEPQKPVETYRGMPLDDLLRDMARKPVATMKKRFPRAHVVYWLELEGGVQIAFKPQM